jgi:hypothetical protein
MATWQQPKVICSMVSDFIVLVGGWGHAVRGTLRAGSSNGISF